MFKDLFYTVFPIGDFAAELPQDFYSYDDAFNFGVENYGLYGKDFVIEVLI